MLKAKGLESDSDDESVVSFEETPEERKHRRMLKKQKARRDQDRVLRKQQADRRKQREFELTLHLKALEEAAARERAGRWGFIPTAGQLVRTAPPRQQDVPKQPYECVHPAFQGIGNGFLMGPPYPRKMLGESEAYNAAFKSPVVFGYRVGYEKLGTSHKIPLPKKVRDPRMLETRCRVCAWDVPGCPGCWRPASKARGYNKHGGDAVFSKGGGKDEGHGAKGSFAPSAAPHTRQVDRSKVLINRRTRCYLNIYVKGVPAGPIIKLRLAADDTVSYMVFQYRMQAGPYGLDDAMYFLFPTESGLIVTSTDKWDGSEVVAGYNYGAYKLSDYRLNIPETNAAFLRVNRISEALTPRLIQTFYRSNFTMTRPWLTRILRHMSFLPPSMPGPDEAQRTIAGWMTTAVDEIRKWVTMEEDEIKKRREQADAIETAAQRTRELHEVSLRNKSWHRARRRDARQKLLAATAAGFEPDGDDVFDPDA